MKYIVIVFAIIFSFSAYSQEPELHTKSKKAIKNYEESMRMYRLRFDAEAKELVLAALEEDSNFLEARILLGEMYLDSKQYDKGLIEFTKAAQLDTENEIPVIYRMLAECEIHELKLMEAIEHLEKYKSSEGVSDYAKKNTDELIDLALFRKRMIENPVQYNPVNLGEAINTEYIEHSPTLTVDENTLYFTRKHPTQQVGGREYYDENIFVSYRGKDGKWSVAEQLGPEINTPDIEGASAISPDGKYLFFTRCKGRGPEANCDIYFSRNVGGKWTKARNLGEVINSRNWESQPSFAPDGRTLYYVKRVGKRGETRKNIYRSKIQDNGTWSKPVSISINTSGNEESPFTHPDGQTFYFTSDGYPGLGKRDLFMVKIDSNGEFQEPINLGYPINSHRDEVSLTVSPQGSKAYFASGMDGGFGKWDIYSFELPVTVRPEPVYYSKGLVYNEETKSPVGAKFEIIDMETGNIVIESFSDKKNGSFLVTLPTGKEYGVNVSANGYLFFSANYTLDPKNDSAKVSFDIPLKPIKEGKAIVLNNVFFAFNSYELKDESRFELDRLVTLLTKNPKMHIEIGGHTDNKGTQAYNQKLSENRAKSVYEYLISQGLPADRLSYKGYNFTVPVATNDTSEGRAKNRRTEFKIVKMEE